MVNGKLVYKKNPLDMLKQAGVTTYRIRKDALLSESSVQKLRRGDPVGWENLETLCCLLECGIDDIIEFVVE